MGAVEPLRKKLKFLSIIKALFSAFGKKKFGGNHNESSSNRRKYS